ncbi:MAG: nucleoside recognition protein, partial [Lachnospiraceae bacterium]|nr:nucleoside recognition protein [Lachnospiraceae bacterium]
MLNYIWIFMILSGILLGALNGNMSLVTSGLVDSSKEAINLCIVMVGVVGMWSGLMQVAKAAGMIDRLTKTMNPVISFLYPRLPKGHPARDYIATNMIANILGLGWAATPSAVKAMEELA